MSNDEFATLIADLAAAGVGGDLLRRTVSALASGRNADLSADIVEDRRAKDRERKRLARAAVRAASADTPSPSPAPSPEKETPPPAPPLKKNKPQPLSPTLFGAADEIPSLTPLKLEPEPKAGKRGTRLPTDWVLPKQWGEWALTEFPFLTVEAVRQLAEEFRDYWAALPGAKGLKLDWFATWRNGVRMRAGKMRGGTGQRMTKAEQLGEELRNEIGSRFELRSARREAGGDLQSAPRLLAVSRKAG